MPTTPSWNDGSKTASAGSTSPLSAKARSTCASASLAHAGLERAPLAVDRVEHRRELVRARGVVGEQAFDAERHVGEPPGGVQARPDREAEVGRARLARIAPGDREQRRDARLHAAGADPLQALRDQAAVVAVEADDVGDGAERDQVEQRVEPRLLGDAELAALAQLGAQREQHVEDRRRRRRGACSRSRSPAGSG